ncbi:MAG: hypothetical protein RLZZ546_1075 [Bacteroidota bacterium]|jgi:hypothetical protein
MKTHYTQNDFSKGWQGYVGVPKGHPLHGKSYTDILPLHIDQSLLQTPEQLVENKGAIPAFLAMFGDEEFGKSIAYQFNVHGGITYSGYTYWDVKEIDIPSHPKAKKLIKAIKLRNRTGNELFSHYYKKEDSIAKERISSVHESLDRLIGYLEIEVLQSNQYAAMYKDGTVKFKEYVDDNWYFGWDSAHYGDTAESCPYEYAVEQTEYLKKQIEDWTLAYFD